MPERHSTSGRPVPAAAYYRMSTDKQEHSIGRQKGQVVPYARQKGYELVAEYQDEGIAGDEFARRGGFQRLLKDAAAGKFATILVDEPSRLSRQDPIEFIVKIVDPLRRAGVAVDTVASGPLDYESLAGVILSVVHADKSSGESKALSRRVLTGLLERAKLGRQAPAITPYGFRAERDPWGSASWCWATRKKSAWCAGSTTWWATTVGPSARWPGNWCCGA
jgi:DNA invertase Pin-like site-specific DNA recombinase